MHTIPKKLMALKIPALSGRGAENNRIILETLAMNGPLLKYKIFTNSGLARYSTVSRRVDDLVERRYLGEADRRLTERGKRTEETMYGLTWKGFIASLSGKEVRENILQVLQVNPLLAFPQKETVLTIIKELVTQQELETIARAVLEVFLKTIPSLELVENNPLSIMMWLLSIKEKPKLPEGFKLSKTPKDAWELLYILDKPDVLEAVKENVVPLVRQKTKEMEMVYRLLSTLNAFCDFISDLEVEDQPSKKVKEYIENLNLQDLLEEE